MYRAAAIFLEMFGKIESTLTNKVIPPIVGQPAISDEDRDWFSFALKMAGLSIREPRKQKNNFQLKLSEKKPTNGKSKKTNF